MRRYILFLIFISFSSFAFSQTGGEIKGTIKDAATGETIIGASVLIGEGKGVVTDINGNFDLKVDSAGQYILTISYVGYQPQKQKIKVGTKALIFNFNLQTTTLNEVEVVADVAKNRETPVAFSNISSKQIEEELGTRDLPMILNSTPGVYATEQGGGSGDARINIRGFDQTNVAVMVDGIPVNDMENGQVFWSNWDGLGDITKTMQVQRGLGASKLAIPSVGGTINIITKGIDEKRSLVIKQEVNDFGLYKTSFGFNSGQLKGGWGVSVAGSRKWGSEWADGTNTDAWSYFGKVQKRFKKQLFSFSFNGAPQSHGQRYDRLPIGIYSKKLSDKLGINTDSIYAHSVYTTATQGERGLRYNPNWGELTDNGGTSNGTIGFFPTTKHGDIFNERVNYFHKPQFNFSHFWTPNEKLSVSTVVYLSIGHGGTTALKISPLANGRDSVNGLENVQPAYTTNRTSPPSLYYSSTEHPSNNYLRMANNDHIWYGVISSWNYKVNKNISTLFGIDARNYKGSHYQSVYNLMGGDYAIDASSDKNQPHGILIGDPNYQYSVKRVGDKVSYYNDAKVMWGGLFAQAEYKKNKWTSFITASVAETGYQRIDYYKKKDLVINGNTFNQAIGYGDAFYYNGTDHITSTFLSSTVTTSGDTTFVKTGGTTKSILNAKSYTIDSKEARFATTKQKWFLGYTFKGGANYNINDNQNVFVNAGYLNMAPLMNTVFDNNNNEYLNIKNQYVYAVEGGYGYRQQRFAVNVNLYYTIWDNKPLSNSASGPNGTVYYNILGLNALHKGIEVDLHYKILKNIDFEGIVSLGDWKYTSGSTVDVTDENGALLQRVDFSAKNVHVGNSAQTQLGGSLKYTIAKGFYIKPRFTYFAKNYADFVPLNLTDQTAGGGPNNRDRDSWRMPNYGLLDIFLGYDFNYWKLKFTLTAGALNVANVTYITDGLSGTNFDATTTTVFMGMGRRFNIGLQVKF